jgi:hypothetical protein
MGAGACVSVSRARHSRPRLRVRARDESGNIIVMFALLLPVIILVCAIAIDVGYWWVNGKKAQIAADACALAAAGDAGFPKPYNLDHCNFGSPQRDYVRTNLHLQSDPSKSILHESTAVIAPYKGVPKRVEATVEIKVNTFFGTFVGLDSVDIVRRAVAERQEGDGNYAIYSHSVGCPEHGTGESLEFNGNTHWINGRVHSNGQYLVGNSGAEPFWAKIGTRVDCVSLQPHNQIRFGGDGWSTGQTKPDTVTIQDWPAWYTVSDFGITWPSGCPNEWKYETHNSTIPPGVYCARSKIQINGDNISGSITLIAPEIQIDGNDQNFQPFAKNVLIFVPPNSTATTADDGPGSYTCSPSTSSSKEMQLNGNSHTWAGTIFHPCGRVNVNVGGSTIGTPALTGTILGFKVKVNGENFFMLGKDNFGGNTELALWE